MERQCPVHGKLPIDQNYCLHLVTNSAGKQVPCNQRAPVPNGTVLSGGKYSITRKVAEGGMSTIYEATIAGGNRVAIKELRVLPDDPADPNCDTQKVAKAETKFEEEG